MFYEFYRTLSNFKTQDKEKTNNIGQQVNFCGKTATKQ